MRKISNRCFRFLQEGSFLACLIQYVVQLSLSYISKEVASSLKLVYNKTLNSSIHEMREKDILKSLRNTFLLA